MRPQLSFFRDNPYRYRCRRFRHTGLGLLSDAPIFGRCCQSRHRSFSSRRGAVKVNPDNETYIDDEGQRGVKDSTTAFSITNATASADTAAADTAAADTAATEPPQKPLGGGQDAGGEMGRCRCGR